MKTVSNFRPSQVEATQWMLDTPHSGYWADPGMGKTGAALYVMQHSGDWERALICAPIRVVLNTWPDEIAEWDFCRGLDYSIIRTDEIPPDIRDEVRDCRRLARLRGASQDEVTRVAGYYETRLLQRWRRQMARGQEQVHIINHESVEWLLRVHGPGGWPYDLIIIDEASRYQNHQAKKFKALAHIRPKVNRLHELTGSPASEGYHGLFSQFYLLDEGKTFGKAITPFRKTYFDQSLDRRKYVLKPGKAEEIERLIAPMVLVQLAEDHLDLEKPNVIPRYVTLTDEEKEKYDRMEAEAITELASGAEITALNSAGVNWKLLQMASGSVYDADGKAHYFHSHKLDAVEELADEVQGLPLLIAYWFKPSLTALRVRFKDAVALDKVGSQVAPWNKGQIKKLLVHPMSVGHGLNMQFGPGHDVCFYDLPWPRDPYMQTIRRLLRPPQKKVVRVHQIIARGTHDVLVARAQRRKENVEMQMLRRLVAIQRGSADAAHQSEF